MEYVSSMLCAEEALSIDIDKTIKNAFSQEPLLLTMKEKDATPLIGNLSSNRAVQELPEISAMHIKMSKYASAFQTINNSTQIRSR